MNKIFVLDDFNPNIGLLCKEYSQHVVELLEDKVNPLIDLVVQKKFHVIRKSISHPILDSLNYTKTLIHSLVDKYKFTDVTYRLLLPGTVYNWHQDKGIFCCHIPLFSNDGCFFIYEYEHYKMPVGKVYYVNTGMPHTFCNAGLEPRVHITFENL